MSKILALSVILLSVLSLTNAGKKQECEVCESVINQLYKQVADDASFEEIEKEFLKWCKTAEGREEKFCYYIGGAATSATYIVPEMAKPMSWKMPADKICEKLLKKDPQICDLRYEKVIDVNEVDIKKLKVRDLKKILTNWGVDTKSYTEKSEFIAKIEELKSIRAPKKEL